MGKLVPLSAKKVLQKLLRAGFAETHQRGSHLYLKSADGSRTATVPTHGAKDIPVGTLHNIVVRQAGLSVDEFNEL
ncbi:MAG: type II toxin-antitoxin system HicA family toxin [bacterium]|nr:type II toxin-antitoxin system HicA family toxin [bacterium]